MITITEPPKDRKATLIWLTGPTGSGKSGYAREWIRRGEFRQWTNDWKEAERYLNRGYDVIMDEPTNRWDFAVLPLKPSRIEL